MAKKGVQVHPAEALPEVHREEYNKMVADVASLHSGDLLITGAALAIGSDKPKVATGAFIFQVDGVRERKTAVSAGTAFTATTHDIADPDAAGREAIYVLSIAAGGAITITKGTTAALGAAVAPATPPNEVKLGEVLIAHDGSAIFDATTNDLDAAHLTVTYTSSAPYALTAETALPH